jgi:hypothetical protein
MEDSLVAKVDVEDRRAQGVVLRCGMRCGTGILLDV